MTELKYLGFWKEEGYEKMPSILNSIGRQEVYSEKFKKQLFTYLLQAPHLTNSFNHPFCLINGRPILFGDNIVSDGKWVWKLDILYYEKQYKIKFPKEFINHIKRAFNFTSLFFWIKIVLLKKSKTHKITQIVFKSNSFPSPSLNGEHFCLFSPKSKYKTVITIRLVERDKNIKTTPLQMLTIYKIGGEINNLNKFDFALKCVLVETTLKDKNMIIKLNSLSLNSVYLKECINKQFIIYSQEERFGLGTLDIIENKEYSS